MIRRFALSTLAPGALGFGPPAHPPRQQEEGCSGQDRQCPTGDRQCHQQLDRSLMRLTHQLLPSRWRRFGQVGDRLIQHCCQLGQWIL